MAGTPGSERTIGQLVADATHDLEGLVRGEIALATAEVTSGARVLGKGAGLLAGAAFFALMGLVFLLHSAAWGIAEALPVWAGYLIVGAVVAGFPGDDGLWVGGARVRDVLTAQGADIYGNPGVVREVYSLRAQVRRGASGGPVLDPSGAVVGMVFATSLDDPDTGYALTLDEISAVLAQGSVTSAPVATGQCTTN